jgi:hypothetical protein
MPLALVHRRRKVYLGQWLASSVHPCSMRLAISPDASGHCSSAGWLWGLVFPTSAGPSSTDGSSSGAGAALSRAPASGAWDGRCAVGKGARICVASEVMADGGGGVGVTDGVQACMYRNIR